MAAKRKATWNPAHHPRDSKGRFIRSATRVMKPADRKRAQQGMTGFKPAEIRDVAAAGEWLQRAAAATPSADGGAIGRYLDGGWRDTNPALRSGKPVADLDQLDAAFTELDDDVMLRRIVPLKMFNHIPLDQLVGMKVRDAAPASTSVDRPGPPAPGAVTMHIATPAGTKAYVHDEAGEVLLARDAEVAITDAVQNDDGGWEVWGVLIPAKDAPDPAQARRRRDPDTADSDSDGEAQAQGATPAAAEAPGTAEPAATSTEGDAEETTPAKPRTRRNTTSTTNNPAADSDTAVSADGGEDGAATRAGTGDADSAGVAPSPAAGASPAAGGSTAGVEPPAEPSLTDLADQNLPEPAALAVDGPLAEFTAVEQARIRVAVQDKAGQYAASPLVGRNIGDIGRYIGEGSDLADIGADGRWRRVAEAVRQILGDEPQWMDLDNQAKRDANAQRRRDDAQQVFAAVEDAFKAGDYQRALTLVDRGEQIDPGYRPLDRRWDTYRGVLRRKAAEAAAADSDDASTAGTPAPADAAVGTPEDQVRAAIQAIVAGRDETDRRSLVHLADLRDRLTGLSREQQDTALRNLSRQDPAFHLYPNPARNEHTDREQAAGLELGGEQQHLAFYDQPAGTTNSPDSGTPDAPETGIVQTSTAPGDAGAETSTPGAGTEPAAPEDTAASGTPAAVPAPPVTDSTAGTGLPGGAANLGEWLAAGKRATTDEEKRQLTEYVTAGMGEFTDPASGITARLYERGPVSFDDSKSMLVAVYEFFTADGEYAGTGSRAFGVSADTGRPAAEHTLLDLEPSVQGAGFAARFNARNEQFYRDNGIFEVQLTANADVGGYAWARAGYDFASVGTANKLANKLFMELDTFTDPKDRAAAEALIRRVSNADDITDLPLPLEFAMLGWTPQAGNGRDAMWPGKAFMLRYSWDGTKHLDPAPTGGENIGSDNAAQRPQHPAGQTDQPAGVPDGEAAAERRLNADVAQPTRGKWADHNLTSGDRVIFFGNKVRAKNRGEYATVTISGGRVPHVLVRGEGESDLLLRLDAGRDRFWIAPVDPPAPAGDADDTDAGVPQAPAAATDGAAGTSAPEPEPPAEPGSDRALGDLAQRSIGTYTQEEFDRLDADAEISRGDLVMVRSFNRWRSAVVLSVSGRGRVEALVSTPSDPERLYRARGRVGEQVRLLRKGRTAPAPATATQQPDTTTVPDQPDTTTPAAPAAAAPTAPARVPRMQDPQYRRDYERGWRASRTNNGGDALERADMRDTPQAWYHGWEDHSLGAPKWKHARELDTEDAARDAGEPSYRFATYRVDPDTGQRNLIRQEIVTGQERVRMMLADQQVPDDRQTFDTDGTGSYDDGLGLVYEWSTYQPANTTADAGPAAPEAPPVAIGGLPALGGSPQASTPAAGTSAPTAAAGGSRRGVTVPVNPAYRANAQNERIEGPTRQQAQRMAARRKELLATARSIEDTDPEKALDLDSQAWGLERDLEQYGFNPDTGRPVRDRSTRARDDAAEQARGMSDDELTAALDDVGQGPFRTAVEAELRRRRAAGKGQVAGTGAPTADATPDTPAVAVDDEVRVGGAWGTVTALVGDDQIRVRFDGDRFVVAQLADVRGHRPAQREDDLFGGGRTFVPGSRSDIGVADRAQVGRTRGAADNQQTAMFDVSDQQQIEGQDALLDQFFQLDADVPAPAGAADPAEIAASRTVSVDDLSPSADNPTDSTAGTDLSADLSADSATDNATDSASEDGPFAGWSDEQLATAWEELQQITNPTGDERAAVDLIWDEWSRRGDTMQQTAAALPADLGELDDAGLADAYAKLTGGPGPLIAAAVARLGAELDRRDQARIAANETAARRALLAKDPTEYADEAEFEAAANAAADLGDQDALVRIGREWERREQLAELERAQQAAEQQHAHALAVQDAEVAAYAEADRRAQAERLRTEQAMMAARAASLIPQASDENVRSAHVVLGEQGVRQVIGDAAYDEIVANLPALGPNDDPDYAIRAALLELPAGTRARLVTAATDAETSERLRGMTGAELHDEIRAKFFGGVAETPEQTEQRKAEQRAAARESQRRKLAQLRADDEAALARHLDRIRTLPAASLTDAEVEIAAVALDGDPGQTARLEEIAAEATRRQAAAADRAERMAQGPAGPARVRSPLSELAEIEFYTENYQAGYDAGVRLQRARALTLGLPEDATTADIRAAEKTDPRSVPARAAWVLAWYRHLGEFSDLLPQDDPREFGPADDPDVPQPYEPIPPANVAKPVMVWKALMDQAVADRRDGDESGAIRYTYARARAYGIPVDTTRDDLEYLREVSGMITAAERRDSRTEAQQTASFIAEWRLLAAEQGYDPADTKRYGPPDRRTGTARKKPWTLAPTSDEQLRIQRLIAEGWDDLEAFAEVLGVDADLMRRQRNTAAVVGDTNQDRALRDYYTQWAYEQYQRAEASELTGGFLVSKLGQARGIDPLSLFSGDPKRAYRYATEELKRWWREHPRLTFGEFKEQVASGQVSRSTEGNEFA